MIVTCIATIGQVVLAHAPADSAGFLNVEQGTDAVLGIVMRSAQGSSLGIIASNLLFRLLPKDVGQVIAARLCGPCAAYCPLSARCRPFDYVTIVRCH